MSRRRTVTREVRSEDPSLSPEANRLLTEELRQAVGADRVDVPEDALERSRERHGAHGAIVTALVANATVLLFTFLALVVVGVIVSLATGSWWALVIAIGVHALGTLIAAGSAIRLTTEVEHVDPATAARLEEEGVPDPDRVLTELVEDYAGETRARGTTEVVSTGRNENAADPERERARASVEQRTAMTPSAEATSPGGSGSPIAAMPLAIVASLVVITLVLGIVFGGVTWIVPAVTWLAAAAWVALAIDVDGRKEEQAAGEGRALKEGGPQRRTGDGATAVRRRVAPFVAVVVAGVVGFGVMVVLVVTSS
ncbi:MAG TPA: hypothetical protein VFU94_02795 [Conexibacter sp.]|nr:hypothetical protein [Conexibacter sp.]